MLTDYLRGLSPSDGARVDLGTTSAWSRFNESSGARRNFSLSPSEGERGGVRGPFDRIVTAKWNRLTQSTPPHRSLSLRLFARYQAWARLLLLPRHNQPSCLRCHSLFHPGPRFSPRLLH